MTTQTLFSPGLFQPQPGSAPLWRMVLAQANVELKLQLRHPEQLLLTLLIPLTLLVGLSTLAILPLPEPKIATVAPRIITLAIMSSAFTGQAIALGFDRRYGVLKRLAATGLSLRLIVIGRLLAVLGIVAIQLAALTTVAVALGWRPTLIGIPFGIALIFLGTLCFAALGMLLGGTLRADIVLALANVAWFILLFIGGVVIPTDQLPEELAIVAGLLPTGALAEGLATATQPNSMLSWLAVAVLAVWTAAAIPLASRNLKLS